MPKGKGYAGQPKTGVTRETSTNPVKRTGRDDGQGGQKKSGVTQEKSSPKGQHQSGDDNFKSTGGPGISSQISKNPGGMNPSKVDTIESI